MNFNSFKFAIFFIIVYLIYLSLRHKWQNRMLFVVSYLFYSFWDWRFLGLILISTVTDFWCAREIHQHQEKKIRRRFLFLSIGVNLTILGFFKYFNFFTENLITLFSSLGLNVTSPAITIILPVGISFYTFQTMSYTIDVYRKQLKPASHFFDYALYVAFFPQLVAGPIERAKNLMPQIEHKRTINQKFFSEGLFLIYWGYFKKIFIADNLGAFINFWENTNNAVNEGGIVQVLAYAFLIQLYCDFSAYSDIARGTARLMGFDIMVNFRAPLFATNIQDTWNRWHISLTSWIRDYLYFPLATMKLGNRYLNVKLAIIITFLIMGLWHGASWNYVLWGGYNGLLLIAYAIFSQKTRRYRKSLPKPFAGFVRFASILLTLTAAAFGLIFFKASSMSQIYVSLFHLFNNFSFTENAVELLIKTCIYASPLLVIEYFFYKSDDISRLFQFPAIVKYSFLYITFYLMVVFKAQSTNFIYFQF